MKLADCRILSLLVILVLLWISGTDSQTFTERQHENGRRNEVIKVQKRGYYWCWKHCSRLASCIYTVEGTHCRCSKGFTGNGYTCTDIDECNTKAFSPDCSTYATCTNTKGSYYCTCNKGFSGNGYFCKDVNECKENTHDCHKTRANCSNLIPFWKCACKEGYSGNGKECEDVNECTTKAFPPGKACDTYATCTNTIGSYYCTCNQGFTGNGYFCEDINECDRRTDKCARGSDGISRIARCINTFGSYKCRYMRKYYHTLTNRQLT